MDEVEELLRRMRELESEVHVYGPASAEAIQQLEALFGQPMPPSYRAFLARFGSISISNTSYAGIIDNKLEGSIGHVWTATRGAREFCQLPQHYLVVQSNEDGYKCLDFSRQIPSGEFPVIYHMPFRETPFGKLAPNYGSWLVESVRGMVEAWEEDAEDDE